MKRIFILRNKKKGFSHMQQLSIIIFLFLILALIYQSIQIKRLRKQTIEAFKKLCERIFKEGEENFR